MLNSHCFLFWFISCFLYLVYLLVSFSGVFFHIFSTETEIIPLNWNNLQTCFQLMLHQGLKVLFHLL